MVEKRYQHHENIDEKIQSAKLPYTTWKVLFLIDEETGLSEIADILEEDQDAVFASVTRLEQEGLIVPVLAQPEEGVTPARQPGQEAPPEPEQEGPAEPSIKFEDQVESEPPSEVETVEQPGEPEEEQVKDELPEPSDEGLEGAGEISFEEEQAEETEEMPELIQKEEQSEDTLEFDIQPEGGAGEIEEQEVLATSEEDQAEAEDDLAGLGLEFPTGIEEQPAQEEQAAETENAMPEPGDYSYSTEKKTILVVDDSIVIRKMVEIALEDENFSIETAVSGKEGLNMIETLHPDLVILDLMLPDISGIDVLKSIKSGAGLPVIMLSGKDSPQMVETAKKEGADAFLPKPFKDEDLLEKIKTLIKA